MRKTYVELKQLVVKPHHNVVLDFPFHFPGICSVFQPLNPPPKQYNTRYGRKSTDWQSKEWALHHTKFYYLNQLSKFSIFSITWECGARLSALQKFPPRYPFGDIYQKLTKPSSPIAIIQIKNIYIVLIYPFPTKKVNKFYSCFFRSLQSSSFSIAITPAETPSQDYNGPPTALSSSLYTTRLNQFS